MVRLASTTDGTALVTTDAYLLLDVDFEDLGAALRGGATIGDLTAAAVRERRAPEEVTLRATVPAPSKIWAVGFAYQDHRSEVQFTSEVEQPTVFFKAPSSVVGSGQPVVLPDLAPDKVDYEGELGVVIGTRATAVDEAEAMQHVAGFTICNDVSARDVQKGTLPGRPADVSVAKSFDTFTPMGPWLTTLDELSDPADLRLRTWVDDELRQDARTSQLIYPVPYLVAYLSKHTTLEPGDVILTGTPAGVGHKQGKFLRPGSRVRIEIEGLGVLENTIVGPGVGQATSEHSSEEVTAQQDP